MENLKEKYANQIISILTDMSAVLERTLEAAKRESLAYRSNKRNELMFDVATSELEVCLQKMMALSDSLDQVSQQIAEQNINFDDIPITVKENLLKLNQSVAEKTMLVTTQSEVNKEKFNTYISGKRKEIREYETRSEYAATYYNTMMKQIDTQSYLYDKKQ